MPEVVDLLRQARETRSLASHARRVAERLSQRDDKKRLNRYAEELDEQAARLEKQAADMRGPTLF
jgi:hypothetical protein